MKFFRFIGYFFQLRTLIGFKAACVFAIAHLWNKSDPPCDGKLACVPVGPYAFYFPSLPCFEGLFTEIFLKGTYRLTATAALIRAIDCGANIGMSLLYIKLRAPKAEVMCFEPNPAARAVLEKNIEVNNWGKSVTVMPYALGKKKSKVKFFVDDKEATSSGGSTMQFQKNKDCGLDSYTVEVDILSRYIDGKVDFLKIDIEGAEFDVLEELAAKDKLHSISELQLEYHYIPGFQTRTLTQMLTLLETSGFKAFVKLDIKAYKPINTDAWHTYMISAWRTKESVL